MSCHSRGSSFLLYLFAAICLLSAPATVSAQANSTPIIPQLQGLGGDPSGGEEITVSAAYRLTDDKTRGLLTVTASLGDGWHLYSLTQKKGGPLPTRVRLDTDAGYQVIGPFRPSKPPEIKNVDVFNVPVEEHHDEVTFSAPIRIDAPGQATQLQIEGTLEGMVCNEQGGCIPLSALDTDLVARYAGTIDPAQLPTTTVDADTSNSDAASTSETRRTPPVNQASRLAFPSDADFQQGTFRPRGIHTALSGYLRPTQVTPGDTLEIVLTATPDAGWHVYAYEKVDPRAVSKPTLVAVAEPAGWMAGQPQASQEPIVKETGLSIQPQQQYHEGEVTWRVPLSVPADAEPGSYEVQGMIGYQACTEETMCDMPVAAAFKATISVGSSASIGEQPLSFAEAKYSTVANYVDGRETPTASAPPSASPSEDLAFDLSKIQVTEASEPTIWYILVLAFIGGFILNFMPCVLPVIGLKVMAFVQQAGEDRGRVLFLNSVYALGMLSIFWLLATLASAASLGWGEQFNYDGFTIPLVCVVFVMGLSFLGVWEIPIPGFVGSGKASDLATREGFGGAFFKGVLTTILATPCSGPGLATALTWSATKPPLLVYLVFTCMGLGMAIPYLIIGAFPGLVRFIPKPGPWMDTFKQLMGFVLLGTVVYLFTLVDTSNWIPTLALVFALWAACWWIGRTPVTASTIQKAKAWVAAGAFATLIGWFAFGYELNKENELPWQPYSLVTLDDHLRSGKTVLVDFTADW